MFRLFISFQFLCLQALQLICSQKFLVVDLTILLYILKKDQLFASLILCSFSSCFISFCLIFITSLHFLIWICLFLFFLEVEIYHLDLFEICLGFLNVGIDNYKIPFQNCLCWVPKFPGSFAFISFQEFLNFLPDFSDLWNSTNVLFNINQHVFIIFIITDF